MKSIRDLLREAAKRLIVVSKNKTQAWLEAEILLGLVLKQDRTWLVIHDRESISPGQSRAYEALLSRREQFEPIAYLLGEAPFAGELFLVTKQTLIPRPETELLLTTVQTSLMQDPRETLLVDIGTGSGIIAITAKKRFPLATIIASDVSSEALVVAKKNAARLGTSEIVFQKANLLEKMLLKKIAAIKKEHLIILANLPYLPLSDKKVLAKQVTKHEPANALFAPKNGLALNEQLIKQVADYALATTHTQLDLLLEFDPPQARILLSYAKQFTKTVRILKDDRKKARVLHLKFS